MLKIKILLKRVKLFILSKEFRKDLRLLKKDIKGHIREFIIAEAQKFEQLR